MNNSKLFRIITIISGIFFVYYITTSHSLPKSSDNPMDLLISAPPTDNPTKETYDQILPKTSSNKVEVSYFEKKIAGIVASFADSPAGKEYIKNVVKGQNIDLTTIDTNAHIKHDKIKEVKVTKHANGNVVICGDNIEVKDLKTDKFYFVNVGENKFLEDGLDSVFSFAKIGETRQIKYQDGDKPEKIYEFMIIKKIVNYYTDHINDYTLKFGDRVKYCGAKGIADVRVVDHNKKLLFAKDSIHITLNNHSISSPMMTLLLHINFGGKGVMALDNAELNKFRPLDDILKNIPSTKSPYVLVEVSLKQ